MLKGLPASGKSTWAKEQLTKGGVMRISKDDIREQMLGRWTAKKERDVIKIRNLLIRAGIEQKRDVIVDDTNFNPTHERVLRELAKELEVEFEVNDQFLEVSPEVCIERDLKRQKSVGASVIWGMYDKYLAPKPPDKNNGNWGKPRAIIFDVDGTLAHNTSGRSYYDMTKVDKDTPDPLLSVIVDGVGDINTYVDILIVSGRDESARELTEEWLLKNGITYTELFMRKEGDHRDDTIIKEEIYHQFIEPEYAVIGVFDDRPKVCRMWRKLGLRVAQVGNPYIEF